MSPTRTLNVATLSMILLLAGCFGLGDSAEASDEKTPNAPPVLHAEFSSDNQFNLVECSSNVCNFTAYHAAVDPDGDLIELGYDFNLDGSIDYQLNELRGYATLQIPRTEFIESSTYVNGGFEMSDCVNGQRLVVLENSTITQLKTTIALVASDFDDAASAVLITTGVLYENSTTYGTIVQPCEEPTWAFSERDAAGTMSDAGGEKLVHIKMTQGDDLSWSLLKVSIVVDNGETQNCVEADAADDTADCTWAKDGDNSWSTSEEITISEGANNDLCDGTGGGCDVAVTLTKIGVGNEDDKVIREVTSFADANN